MIVPPKMAKIAISMDFKTPIHEYTRVQKATVVAIVFHLSGFLAMAVFKSASFVELTPVNFLVSAALIFYTQERISAWFLAFFFVSSVVGFAAEWIGVNTGVLFGSYSYGTVLGPKWMGVPFLIGLQWFMVMYGVGCCMHLLQVRLQNSSTGAYARFPTWWMKAAIIGDAALLAVFFDWILEPVAVKLGYWQWKDGAIPLLNYYSWWGISLLLQTLFYYFPFAKHNYFALHLLMVQLMFFLLMHLFL